MARIYACVARGGLDQQPARVLYALDRNSFKLPLEQDRRLVRVLSAKTAAILQDCLRFTALEGTAKNGNGLLYRVGGKTGTAEAGKDNRVLAWYCGYLPAETPAYVIAVMVEEDSEGRAQGLRGGQEAAAVFKEIGQFLTAAQ
jgi:cell division protein FtsI/penicillin-binding protein 2